MLLCTSSDKGPYMSGVWWLNVVRFRRFAIPITCPEKKKNNNKDSTEIRKTIKDSNVLESFKYLKSGTSKLASRKQPLGTFYKSFENS